MGASETCLCFLALMLLMLVVPQCLAGTHSRKTGIISEEVAQANSGPKAIAVGTAPSENVKQINGLENAKTLIWH